MPLDRYRQKRNFRVTAEPSGGRQRRSDGSYVVQKHAARRLHYDFRLELDGVLKSWAVPKGPSLDSSVKRLAVEVEDHPIEYGSFEGDIPKGQYGAGHVDIWDRGTWQPEADPRAGLAKGHLRFALAGGKLAGRWSLVRMPERDGSRTEPHQWLLIRAADGAPVRPAARAKPAPAPRRTKRATPMPGSVEFQLATLAKSAPEGDAWAHEIKFDGYRALLRIERGEPRIRTRGGHDWTRHFPEIRDAARTLEARDAILDGEIVILRPDGTTDFQALQNHMAAATDDRPVYFAFDLLHRDGVDLRELPLEERKQALAELIESSPSTPALRYSKHAVGGGPSLLEEACRSGLEGIISKRRDAPHSSGRGRAWIKSKCIGRQEFVIGGFTEPAGARTSLGALLLGVHEEKRRLRYCGRVGTGFTQKSLRELAAKLGPLETTKSPFTPAIAREPGVHWVRPTLVAQVAFGAWTRDGLLRHPVFEGLRADKSSARVTREVPAPAKARATTSKLTHPEKLLFPDEKISKEDLVAYYHVVAARLLPHVVDRPLMILRCPDGVGMACFYQKHLMRHMPEAVRAVSLPSPKGKTEEHLVIDDLAGLEGLVQSGVIEVHAWGARIDRIERPDRIAFDLDPGPGIDWAMVCEAAVEVRDVLAALGLKSFVKTTGGKGLHVVVPLERRYEWSVVKAFTQSVAQAMSARRPERYTATVTKSRRTRRIFIDYLRNGRGATWVVPYSPRARPGALISMPLPWAKVETGADPGAFSVRTLSAKLPADPWRDLDAHKQRLPDLRALERSTPRVKRRPRA